MLYDALVKQLPRRVPMHMPGHKRNALLAPYLKGLGALLDITEIEGFDNLHAPEGRLRDAMANAADLYGARASFFLVNGATGGILAGIRALTRPGEAIVMDRGSHLSVHHGAALCQLRPFYLSTPLCPDTGIPGPVTPPLLAETLRQAPEGGLLALTCPTYQGLLCDLPPLVDMAHQRGFRVLVDAAHGAHLGLHAAFPQGAVASGADLVVHSLHKTLPSLTQTALLHAGSQQAAQAAAQQLDIFQTTSPSYLLMASMDGCVALLISQGDRLLPAWHAMMEAARETLAGLRHLRVYQPADQARDPSKLVISCAEANITGHTLKERLLKEHGIELEMGQERYALAMGGLGDTPEMWHRLIQASLAIDATVGRAAKPPLAPLPRPQAALLSHEALLLPYEDVPWQRAQGRVCGEYVVPYPPGVPLLVPGERVAAQALAWAAKSERLMKTGTKHQPEKVRVLRPVDKL